MPGREVVLSAGASLFSAADQALLVPGGLSSISVFLLKASQNAGSTVDLYLWTAPVGFDPMDTPIATPSGAAASMLQVVTEPAAGLTGVTGTLARVYGARLDPAQALGTLLFWELRATGVADVRLTASVYVVPNHTGKVTAPRIVRAIDGSRFYLMGPAARGCGRCRRIGCPTCEAARIARCFCRDSACRGCGATPVRAPTPEEFEGWLTRRGGANPDLDPRLAKDLAQAFGERSRRWRSVKDALNAALIEGNTPLDGWSPWAAPRSLTDTMDAHAHLAAPTWDEVAEFFWEGTGPFKTNLDGQLATVASGELTKIVLAPNPIYYPTSFQPNTDRDYLTTTTELAFAVALASDYADSTFGYPAYLPMVMVPHWDLRLAETPALVEAALATGLFAGIGEVLVHGHGMDLDGSDYQGSATNEYLLPLVELAALYDVPILFHWDLGSVDHTVSLPADPSKDEYGNTFYASNSIWQLLELLDAAAEGFPDRLSTDPYEESVDIESVYVHQAKIIIAHGGGGPDSKGWATGQAELTTYINYMAVLLWNYPNVYFDISGFDDLWNPKAVPPSAYAVGAALLPLIAAWPERFLFGLDETAPSPNALIELSYYESCLASDRASKVDYDALYWNTAVDVLTSRPGHFEMVYTWP